MNGYGDIAHIDDPDYAIKKAIDGWTPTAFGFLTGPAYSVPFALMLLITGVLADRYNRTYMCTFSCLGWSACIFGMSFANDMSTLMVLRAG